MNKQPEKNKQDFVQKKDWKEHFVVYSCSSIMTEERT